MKKRASKDQVIEKEIAIACQPVPQSGRSASSWADSQAEREYLQRERADAQRKLRAVELAPLADRKEAAAAFASAMRDRPGVVAERLGWLFDGNYGHGAMLMAEDVLRSPRMNRIAALTQMVAALEWQAPSAMARAAWKKLTKKQQEILDKEVGGVIRDAEERESE